MLSGNTRLGIVVGVDESPAAKVAVQWAARDAELRKIPLTLVHATSPEIATWPNVRLPAGLARWHQDHGRRLVDDAFKVVEEATQHGGPAEVHTEILSSAAVPTMVDLSKDAEMVVTGCRGSGRWPGRLMGSVSSGLLRYAHCPVAIIHDEDPLMPHPSKAPVLVGIDGSSASELATAIAFDEASRRNVGLIAVHAWSDVDVSEWPGIDWPVTQSMAEEVLAGAFGGLAGTVSRCPGEPYRRARSAGTSARPAVRRSPARRRRQPGTRRIRRHAVGLGRRNRRPDGTDAGNRGARVGGLDPGVSRIWC